VRRVEIIQNIFKPNFELRKIEIGLSKDQVKSYLYEMTTKDISGELRPNKLLDIFVENDFYEKPLIKDEGYCMTNKQAGIEPSRKSLTLFPENLKVNE
jgi:hypothetical protein